MTSVHKFFQLMTIAALTAAAFVAVPSARAVSGPRCYVDIDAGAGSNDGASWPNAYTSLQLALTDPPCTEIWVAEGVYTPGSSQSDTFNVPPGVAVYGGFDGTEGAFGARNWTANVTILSGDITNNDANGDGNYIAETYADIVDDNSYHVVWMDGTSTDVTSSTVLDGFTITAGKAGVFPSPTNQGGGLYCDGSDSGKCSPTLANLAFRGGDAISNAGALFNNGSAGVSSPTLSHVTFNGNHAANGGAVYNWGGNGGLSSPTFTDVIFADNTATTDGGAIYNDANNGESSPVLTRVSFEGNASYHGGAMYSDASGGTSNSQLRDVSFSLNEANAGYGQGGAMYNDGGGSSGNASPVLLNVTFDHNSAWMGGAMFNSGPDSGSSPTLTNVTFTKNIASGSGGAMANSTVGGIFGIGASMPTLNNVTFSNNAASGTGGAIFNEDSVPRPVLRNVILWGDSDGLGPNEIFDMGPALFIDYSIVQGGESGIIAESPSTPFADGTGNLDTDPVLGTLGDNGGHTQTLALLAGSSAIDTGNMSGCPGADQRGTIRPVDGDASGSFICDIGAFEYVPSHVFDDLPVVGKEWMEPWVNAFYAHGITTGCGASPLIYCPESSVTRAAMAVFILRAEHGPSYVPPAATHTFSDMPVAGKEWMEPWVDQLYAEGITSGCGAGPIFCPEAPVTRAAMAVFLLRTLEGSSYVPPAATHTFSDMPVAGKEWMEPWVDEFYSRGITTGCGAAPLIYCPESSVTRASMAVFVDRAYSLYP